MGQYLHKIRHGEIKRISILAFSYPSLLDVKITNSVGDFTSSLRVLLIQCQEFGELPVEHQHVYLPETGPNDASLPVQRTLSPLCIPSLF